MRVFAAGPDRQIFCKYVNEHQDQHHHDSRLKSPIAMDVPQTVMPRMLVIPRLRPRAFNIVFMFAHNPRSKTKHRRIEHPLCSKRRLTH